MSLENSSYFNIFDYLFLKRLAMGILQQTYRLYWRLPEMSTLYIHSWMYIEIKDTQIGEVFANYDLTSTYGLNLVFYLLFIHFN